MTVARAPNADARRDPVIVGNGQGFWGDSVNAPAALVAGGPLHYLTLDYLAEVTMTILRKQMERDPKAGYARDFIEVLRSALPACMDKGVRIVANAAGVNADACNEAVADVVRELGLSGVRVGAVTGDDVLPRIPDLVAAGEELVNIDTGEPLAPHLDRVISANAYLGAGPMVEALGEGADVVVTGRCSDPSMTVAPLCHEFAWGVEDYDKIAAATIAGHIIECGAQVTGGNFYRWRDVPDLARIGYPLVEVSPDGSFVLTKHAGTGGVVDVQTLSAQMLYEVNDPRAYVSADVVADFTSVQVEEVGPDRVRVSGARGHAPTDSYKLTVGLRGGYRAIGQLTVGGPDAVDKAFLTADILFERLADEGITFADESRLVEILGSNVLYDGMRGDPVDTPEVVLRIGVTDPDRRKAERFSMELAPLLLSGPPGLTGYAGGRPRVTQVVEYWPCLVDKSAVSPRVDVMEVR
ncbi:MAG: acyclic terpene utilization AtuA family protein [Myxococcota bacterium]